MGRAERENHAAGLPRILATRLEGLRVAVDVQHLYKTSNPADRGAVFELPGGYKLAEAQAATTYAQGLSSWLRARGALVLANDPRTGTLTGAYPRRLRAAAAWGADCYLACHVNAGGGSYAALEYGVGSRGANLATRIGNVLVDDFKEILSFKTVALAPGERGRVCIEAFPPERSALIVEPFFGDNPRQQAILSSSRLVELGECIGEGVARWFEAFRGSRLI